MESKLTAVEEEDKPLPVWHVGDIISFASRELQDYLLITEADADETGGEYGVVSLLSIKLINGKWMKELDLQGYERLSAHALDNYKLEG